MRRSLFVPFALALSLLLLSGASGTLHAGEPSAKDRAAESFRQARSAFARRDFTAAALAFEQAAEYEPHPTAWLNAAEAWMAANDAVRAAQDCDHVLDDRTAAPQFRKEAETRMKTILRSVGTLDITGDPQTRVAIDGSANLVLPVHKRVVVGSHVITALDPTSTTPRRFPVTIHPGEVVEIDTKPADPITPTPAPTSPPAPIATETPTPTKPEEPAPPPAASSSSSSSSSWSSPPTISWIAFGVSGAAGIATTVFGLKTISAQHDFTAHPNATTRDDFYHQRTITDVLLTVAVAAFTGGVAIWWASPPSPSTSTSKKNASVRVP